MFNCTVCNKVFTVKRNLTRHITTHGGEEFACSICPKVYTRREKLVNHSKKFHGMSGFNLQNVEKKPQKEIMTGPTIPIAQIEPSIISKIWSEKDINMMMEEDDLHSRKRSNDDFMYSNKLQKTRMNLVNTSSFVEVASSHSKKIV
jgi:uncharacterized C2H2 Zn-finger protein